MIFYYYNFIINITRMISALVGMKGNAEELYKKEIDCCESGALYRWLRSHGTLRL